MPTPRTIKILLLDGDPNGLQTVELGGWDGKAVVVPRNKLKQACQRDECNGPALYFLLGLEQEDSVLPKVYIGEAESLCDRLLTHDGEKDFWHRVVAFIGKDINKAHVRYLESRSIEKARGLHLCNLVNKTVPASPRLSEADIADLEIYFENLKLILSTLGFSFLKDLPSRATETADDPLFYCSGKGAQAVGRMTGEGFIVYRSSTASKHPSAAVKKGNERFFEEMKKNGSIDDQSDELYTFTKDFVFKSPSAASDIILGNSSNGWEKWKTTEGKSLDEVFRKNARS